MYRYIPVRFKHIFSFKVLETTPQQVCCVVLCLESESGVAVYTQMNDLDT